MAEKQKPDRPELGPGQMQNPFPPQYGTKPPPPVEHDTITLDNAQEPSDLPLQIMNPREPDDAGYDVYKLAPHVEVGFDDTFTEPEGASGLRFMAAINKAIYQSTHLIVYASLTLVCGPLMTLLCGITFALNHLIIVWMVQPCIKLSFLWFRIQSMYFATCVRLFFDPCYTSASLLFSGIRGRFRVDASDIAMSMKHV